MFVALGIVSRSSQWSIGPSDCRYRLNRAVAQFRGQIMVVRLPHACRSAVNRVSVHTMRAVELQGCR